MERDTLGVREVRLFGAAVRWAEAEAQRQQLQPTPENKRRVLGKALGLIRFPLMTIEEFAAGNYVLCLNHSQYILSISIFVLNECHFKMNESVKKLEPSSFTHTHKTRHVFSWVLRSEI